MNVVSTPSPTPERVRSEAERELESRYLGTWNTPDDVDPELEQLGHQRNGLQPVVLLLVMLFTLYLARSTWDDLQYSSTPNQPILLGEASDLDESEHVQDGRLVLPSNRHVSVSGAPSERSVAGQRAFVRLVGSQIYLERVEIDTRPRVLQGMPMAPNHNTEVRDYFNGSGRLIAFQDLPDTYGPFIDYYSLNYGREFCGFEPAPQVRVILAADRARAEQRLADHLGRVPTEAERRTVLGNRFECQNAYLLVENHAPLNFTYLKFVYAAFALILIGCSYFVFAWLRRGRRE
jgi:hypothetical protein